jgi:hypothetical protein
MLSVLVLVLLVLVLLVPGTVDGVCRCRGLVWMDGARDGGVDGEIDRVRDEGELRGGVDVCCGGVGNFRGE